MLMFVLGLLDIVVAAALWMSSGTPFAGNGLVMALGILWIIKGLFSILSSAAGGWLFDYMGWPDLVAGVFLLLSYYGLGWHFLFYIALVMLIKGLYSAGTDFLTTFLRGK